MSNSIFSQIIAGVVPCHKVYEDDFTLAFLDIHPIQPGHVLVVPKNAREFVWDLDPEQYSALMDATQKVAQRLKLVLKIPYVGVKIVGVDVPHAHVHLIPFTTVEEYNAKQPAAEPNHEVLEVMAKRLYF